MFGSGIIVYATDELAHRDKVRQIHIFDGKALLKAFKPILTAVRGIHSNLAVFVLGPKYVLCVRALCERLHFVQAMREFHLHADRSYVAMLCCRLELAYSSISVMKELTFECTLQENVMSAEGDFACRIVC